MSTQQIQTTIEKINNYVFSMLDHQTLFIDKAILEKARFAWHDIGSSKITELNERISKCSDEVFDTTELTNELLEFKIDIIDFLSKHLKRYAKRVLNCIITFLKSLTRAISDIAIKMIIEILIEILIFIKNILKCNCQYQQEMISDS